MFYVLIYDFPAEPAPVAESKITPTQLYSLLNEKDTSLIVMDVRPTSQYAESHIKHEACISVPSETIKPG